jgi:hypothetical protein
VGINKNSHLVVTTEQQTPSSILICLPPALLQLALTKTKFIEDKGTVDV